MSSPITFSRRTALATGGAAMATPALSAAAEPTERNILRKAVSSARLGQVLLPRDRWKPFPTLADRTGWEALPAATRTALIEEGASALARPWALLPATTFLEYRRVGNRSRYEAINKARREKLRTLVMAECAEGKGRFLDEIVNGLWATLEESWWGFPAHLNAQKAGSGLPDVDEPVVDLFAAETSALLSWALYLIGPAFDKVSPLIRPRIHAEIERRILAPLLARTDWGWMGYAKGSKPNNWNPWICSNWLISALLTDRDEARRRAGVMKALEVADHFLNGYDDDGGCDEGPGYWNAAGGALFDNLELLRSASGGQIDVYGVPLVKEIGRYIYRAHIAGDWYTNFADASAVVHIDGNMVWRYGQRIGDAKMASLGAWAAKEHNAVTAGSINRQLNRIFTSEEMKKSPASETLVRDVWLPGIQVMTARMQEGSTKGLYIAAQGGHNAESHNHNDVGNFMVYANGKPAIIDVGVETYSAKTFSSKRYEIWTMQSAYHNCPTIDGVMQSPGRQFEARDVKYSVSDAAAEMSMDIAAAYPKEAGLKSWRRTLRFDRGKGMIEVRDRYAASKAPKEIALTLMTIAKMRPAGAGAVLVPLPMDGSPALRIEFDGALFQATQEEIAIEDGRLKSSWGSKLYRILLTAKQPGAEREWVVRFALAARG
jgi:hypothetical protein